MGSSATGNNLRPMGLIKFGSDNDAVLHQDSLTTEPTEGSALTGTATFDSEGFDSNGTGAWLFDLAAIGVDYESLMMGGQASISVDTAHITFNNNSDNDYGITPIIANDYLLSWSSDGAVGSTYAGRLFMATSNYLAWQMEWNLTPYTGDNRVHYYGKGDYVTVTMSWDLQKVDIFIDGLPWKTLSHGMNIRTLTDLFRYWTIGSYEGRSGGGSNEVYLTSTGLKLKNFIVSNRPVMLASHPKLAKLVWGGDSFAVTAKSETKTMDYSEQQEIKRYFANKGLRLGTKGVTYPEIGFATAQNGGYIDKAGVELDDQLAGTLALNGTIFVSHCGMNDSRQAAVDFNIATIETKYKAYITSVLDPATNYELFLAITPITTKGDAAFSGSEQIANTAALHTLIMSLPEWWDTNNPTRTGMVKVVDLFSAIGGEDPDPRSILGLYWADASYYLDNVHLAPYGQQLSGKLIAKCIDQWLSD